MSESKHSVAIGAFILGALLIAVTLLIFIAGAGLGSDRERVVMVFDGSVKGLSTGAPVALRGVQIGQVTDIRLIMDSDTVNLIMLVEADIDSKNIQRSRGSTENLVEELISRGMRAQLNTQSLLTGLLYVQLDFHPDSRVNLADIESDYTQVPTIPTELQKLTRQIEDLDFAQIATDLRDIATGVKEFISNEQFQGLPQELRDTLASVTALSEELRQVAAASGPKLDELLTGADSAVAAANSELPKLTGMVGKNLALLENAIATFEHTMQEISGLVSSDSPTNYELNSALRELAKAGQALQLLARTLEEQPEALLRGKSEE